MTGAVVVVVVGRERLEPSTMSVNAMFEGCGRDNQIERDFEKCDIEGNLTHLHSNTRRHGRLHIYHLLFCLNYLRIKNSSGRRRSMRSSITLVQSSLSFGLHQPNSHQKRHTFYDIFVVGSFGLESASPNAARSHSFPPFLEIFVHLCCKSTPITCSSASTYSSNLRTKPGRLVHESDI